MNITINGTPKEVAALVLELQERHNTQNATAATSGVDITKLADEVANGLSDSLKKTISRLPD